MLHGSHTVGGGDTVYIHQLQLLLPKYGIVCELISVEKAGSRYSIITSRDQETIYFANTDLVNSYIKTFCDQQGVDIIHIHTMYLPKITQFCLSIRPVIKSAHSTDIVCPGSYKFYSNSEKICKVPFGKHCLVRAYTNRCCSRLPSKLSALYNNVDAEIHQFSSRYQSIVVMSEYVRNECIAAGISANNIKVNPYFTLPREVSKTETSDQRILYVGRLSQVKGVHHMISAIAELLRSRQNVFLDIVGDGPYKAKLMDQIDELRLNEKVIFHGWLDRDEIDEMLYSSYLVVFPSIYPEAFGISGIEAMMHGKPVVAFNVGGVTSWLSDNISGFLIPEKDQQEFGRKVALLLDNEPLAHKMGMQGREMAMEKFIPEVHVPKLISIYEEAIGKPQSVPVL